MAAAERRQAIIACEQDAVRAELPEHCIATCTEDMILIHMAASNQRKLTIRVLFLDEFPVQPIACELSSDQLAEFVVTKLQKLTYSKIEQIEPGYQAVTACKELRKILMTNKFLGCMDEVKRIKTLVDNPTNCKVNETAGTIKLKLTSGKYSSTVSASISDRYPEEGVSIRVIKTNIPDKIVKSYMLQVQQIIKRCEHGFSEEVAVAKRSLDRSKHKVKDKAENVIHVTSDHMRSLKHDVRFLHKVSDMRKFHDERRSGNVNEFAHSAKDRKQVRRQLKQMTKVEAAAEEERLKAIEEELSRELQALTTTPSVTATKSLALSIEFLINELFIGLPQKKCAFSEKLILPQDPAKAKKYAEDKQHARHPIRVLCGHWFLLKWLNRMMTTPPFGKSCPHCGETLQHPRWSNDVKKLEKAWATKEAKKRELAEVSDFFDLSTEFISATDAETNDEDGELFHESDEDAP